MCFLRPDGRGARAGAARSVIAMQDSTPTDDAETKRPTTEPDRTTLAAARRIHRARTESMSVALRATGGVYDVRTGPDAVYRVDISAGTCSCPDWRRRERACKHLYRVRFEVQSGTVPTPDGRLPDRQRSDGQSPTNLKSPASATVETSSVDTEPTSPHTEFDRYGVPTGTQYYRCDGCWTEAVRQCDLAEHEC